jgi:hypothetical protein
MGGLRTVNLNSLLLPHKPMGWGLESSDISPGRTSSHIPGKSWITRSISLMPMNGAMIPPRP